PGRVKSLFFCPLRRSAVVSWDRGQATRQGSRKPRAFHDFLLLLLLSMRMERLSFLGPTSPRQVYSTIGGYIMKRILGVAAAVVLTLTLASNAKAQSWSGGYYNPWTGTGVYAGSVYNPWTGGYYSGSTVYNPWLGGSYSAGSGYSPWTGNYYGRQSF